MLNLNRNNMNFFVYMEIGADLFSKIKWSVLVGLEGAWCQKISEGMELYRWEWVWRSIADQSQKQQSQSGNFVDYTIHYICELTKLSAPERTGSTKKLKISEKKKISWWLDTNVLWIFTWISFGKVALNIRVWRFPTGGMVSFSTIRRIWGSNPMSSIRSASSKTRNLW